MAPDQVPAAMADAALVYAGRPVPAVVPEPNYEDVIAATGISYRQLDYWTRRGFLTATYVAGNRGAGQGGRSRQWSKTELVAAQTMVRLIDAGFTLVAAARIARGCQIDWPDWRVEPSSVVIGAGLKLEIAP